MRNGFKIKLLCVFSNDSPVLFYVNLFYHHYPILLYVLLFSHNSLFLLYIFELYNLLGFFESHKHGLVFKIDGLLLEFRQAILGITVVCHRDTISYYFPPISLIRREGGLKKIVRRLTLPRLLNRTFLGAFFRTGCIMIRVQNGMIKHLTQLLLVNRVSFFMFTLPVLLLYPLFPVLIHCLSDWLNRLQLWLLIFILVLWFLKYL